MQLAYLQKNSEIISDQADYVLQSDTDFYSQSNLLFRLFLAGLIFSIPVIIIYYKTGGNFWMPAAGPKYKGYYKVTLVFLFLLYIADFLTFLSTFTHASYSKGIKVTILCTVPIIGLFFSLIQYCIKSCADHKIICGCRCCLLSTCTWFFFMIVIYVILSVLPGSALLFFIHPVNTAIITIYPMATIIFLGRWKTLKLPFKPSLFKLIKINIKFHFLFSIPFIIIIIFSVVLGAFFAKMIQDSDTQKIQVILTFIPPIIGIILTVYPLKGWIKKGGEQTGGTTSSTNGNEEELESSRPSGTPNANYGSTEHTTLVVNDTDATN